MRLDELWQNIYTWRDEDENRLVDNDWTFICGWTVPLTLIWSVTMGTKSPIMHSLGCERQLCALESWVSGVADLLYEADRATYGVKWTIFFCLFVLFCQAGEEKQKKKSDVTVARKQQQPLQQQHQHTWTQSAKRSVFNIQCLLLLIHCNNTGWMYQCAISLVCQLRADVSRLENRSDVCATKNQSLFKEVQQSSQ